MRVIGGAFKSRKLISIKNSQNLRPTLDRIKESIFDIIGFSIKGSNFIDLFSGTGSIGIEAISRGAANVFFVEKSRKNFQIIKNNLDNLQINKDLYKLFNKDVLKFLAEYKEPVIFDFVFADPPYDKGFFPKTLNFLDRFPGINENTIIIFETSNKDRLINNCSFNLIKVKKYGDTVIHFLKKGG
jgi:16S rRNA (guanine966-N2)-methyltransferase